MTLFLLRNLGAILRRHPGMGIAFAALMVCATSLPLFAPSAAAEPRQAPNSRIALDLEDRFTPSDRFSGFVDEASGASFVIIDLPPQAYEEVKKIPEGKEALAEQGLSEAMVSELAGRKGEYVYFTGKQTVGGQIFAKFVLIFREAGVTAMISSNVPQAAMDAGTFTKTQIETVLAAAIVKDTAAKAIELFRLGYLGPFQEAFSLLGTAKAYSVSGTQPAAGENRMVKEPTLIVSPSLDGRIVDVKPAAQRSFQTLGGLQAKTVESEKVVTIGGLKGYQIIGETQDKQSGTKITLNFVLLAGNPDGYYAIVATTPLADKEKFMAEIEKVIASFEPVKPKQ
jgi:hypothetical protein